MIIDLESIFNVEGLSKEFDYEVDMSSEELYGYYPFKTPVRVKGKVANETGIVEVNADACFELNIPCSRCAKEMSKPMKVHLGHTLVRELNNESNDDLLCVENMQFELDELVKEDVFLSMPYKFLCSEDCLGICSGCGKNLNEGPCSCEAQTDPRLDILKQLLDN